MMSYMIGLILAGNTVKRICEYAEGARLRKRWREMSKESYKMARADAKKRAIESDYYYEDGWFYPDYLRYGDGSYRWRNGVHYEKGVLYPDGFSPKTLVNKGSPAKNSADICAATSTPLSRYIEEKIQEIYTTSEAPQFDVPLDTGGKLIISPDRWYIKYEFSSDVSPVIKTNLEIESISIHDYINAWEENFKRYTELKELTPHGKTLVKSGAKFMRIHVNDEYDGVCLCGNHLRVNTTNELARIIKEYNYAMRVADSVCTCLNTGKLDSLFEGLMYVLLQRIDQIS